MTHEDAEMVTPSDDFPPRKSRLSTVGNLLMEYSALLALLIIGGGVVGIMAFPAIQKARRTAQRQQAMENLKQIGLAMHNYAQLHPTLPPQETPRPTDHPPGNEPAPAP